MKDSCGFSMSIQSTKNEESAADQPAIVRRGAVAVVVRDQRLLLVRRSKYVIAPRMYCFPGGGIEAGETEEQALVRELDEELACVVVPRQRLWEHVSPWRVHLAFWLADLDSATEMKPDPREVESVHWVTLAEMTALADQLDSNHRFLEALARGEFALNLAE
jgi:8-oxo-dGTP diphosphatase